MADGTVIAVLGTSHEKDNCPLSADVAVKGAVISEYPPLSQSQRSFFRERNRISAALSVGVVAVEAPEGSGTALFVEEAAEQGKEIFAVPGNADSAGSAGTLSMLKDGAKLVTCGWDVVSEFEYLYPQRLHPPVEKAPVFRSDNGQGEYAAASEERPDEKKPGKRQKKSLTRKMTQAILT